MTEPVGGHVRVAVIGCGFAGLGAAVRLRREGVTQIAILERASSLGGVWRDNTYPGCACDIPSHLYSYSYAPNPRWPRVFSSQQDIRDYLEQVADDFDVRRHIHLDTDVLAARWQPEHARWHVETSRGELTAAILVTATGMHSAPKIPDIPGLDTFPGHYFHSTEWDHGYDMAGKRIAVVGTGTSAAQFIPAIQPSVARLTLFQRHPAWLLPKFDRPHAPAEQWLYEHVPPLRLLMRGRAWAFGEFRSKLFTQWLHELRLVETAVAIQLRLAVKDPALRAKLTPDYRLGCKRVVLSNSYYHALTKPNVDVAPGLARIEGSTLIAQDGTAHEADAIVFATGFRVVGRPITYRIAAADGTSLGDAWRGDGGIQALRGTTVAGYPNLLMLVGPNTTTSTSSKVLMIEAQLNYLANFVRKLDALAGPGGGGIALEPDPEAMRVWNERLRSRLKPTVWETGCSSPYLDYDGHGGDATHWPGTTRTFRRTTQRVDLDEYQVVRADRRSLDEQPNLA